VVESLASLVRLYFFSHSILFPRARFSNTKMAIASDKMVFYYMARDNLCFLTLCEEAYPKRLAFLYLDEIADLVLQELLHEYGTNVRTS
jgi:Regulated-SNARE-like domain